MKRGFFSTHSLNSTHASVLAKVVSPLKSWRSMTASVTGAAIVCTPPFRRNVPLALTSSLAKLLSFTLSVGKLKPRAGQGSSMADLSVNDSLSPSAVCILLHHTPPLRLQCQGTCQEGLPCWLLFHISREEVSLPESQWLGAWMLWSHWDWGFVGLWRKWLVL